MDKITIGWMYPNILNLHGERGSVQALEKMGKEMGLQVEVRRIEIFSDPIPFDELDLLIFLPGEIASFRHLFPALRSQKEDLDRYLDADGYLLALGTTGLMFGNAITREDGTILDGLGYLDMTAKERKYVWGDDLHIRLANSGMELVGSQIMMADVDAKHPFAQILYGRGNNNTGAEGARWKNLIYTNCMGPLMVKNPWFGESILLDICQKKGLTVTGEAKKDIAKASFESTLQFIANKPKQ